jgi:transcriptional regulator with XRE-family HTH domain
MMERFGEGVRPSDESGEEADMAPRAPAAAHASAPSWALDWGRLLRIARQVAGLSLTELSARTGLSKGYLSKLEAGAAGAANPSRATLAALARALPSFRPLAHTLAPGLDPNGITFAAARSAEATSAPPAVPVGAVPYTVGDTPSVSPIQLGWRELEVLTALITLEASALPMPITAPVLARAVGRGHAATAEVLARLTAAEVVVAQPATRMGAVATYRCAADCAARIGVTRIGDLLLLAAALIAGAPHAREESLYGESRRDAATGKR